MFEKVSDTDVDNSLYFHLFFSTYLSTSGRLRASRFDLAYRMRLFCVLLCSLARLDWEIFRLLLLHLQTPKNCAQKGSSLSERFSEQVLTFHYDSSDQIAMDFAVTDRY